MKISEIIWIAHFVAKIESKHGLSTDEVEQIFRDRPRIEFAERGNVKGQDLYRAIGQTDSGRCLVVFFIQTPRSGSDHLSTRSKSARA